MLDTPYKTDGLAMQAFCAPQRTRLLDAPCAVEGALIDYMVRAASPIAEGHFEAPATCSLPPDKAHRTTPAESSLFSMMAA